MSTTVLSGAVSLAELIVTGSDIVQFDPAVSTTLTITAGSIVLMDSSRLVMQPASRSVIHKIVFSGINEALYHPGATPPMPTDLSWAPTTPCADGIVRSDRFIDTDRGLLIMDEAHLVAQGLAIESWELGKTAADAETTWDAGDELLSAPMVAGVSTWRSYTKGGTLHADSASQVSPYGTYLAEILNTFRNVRIWGTDATHRAHVMVMSMHCQVISGVDFRYMGPRMLTGGKHAETTFVKGRYALHFHLVGEPEPCAIADGDPFDSDISVVTKCIARDGGSHAFVPHGSHHITFDRCVAYNTQEDAFWWDPAKPLSAVTQSNDIVWNECLAAGTYVESAGDNHRDITGFQLGNGARDTCTGCHAAGIQGGEQMSGFKWKTSGDDAKEAIWDFRDNVSHNNTLGIWVYQNTKRQHRVDDMLIFNCIRAGVDNGAYRQPYIFEDVIIWTGANDAVLRNGTASKFGDGGNFNGDVGVLSKEAQTWRRVTFHGAADAPYSVWHDSTPQPWAAITNYIECVFRGYTDKPIKILQAAVNPASPANLHFCRCTVNDGSGDRDLTAADFRVVDKSGADHAFIGFIRITKRDGSDGGTIGSATELEGSTCNGIPPPPPPPSDPPTVHTGIPILLDDRSIQLNGTVDTGGADTDWHFEWGETTGYGNDTPVVTLDAGDGDTAVLAVIVDLVPDETYHVRLTATNTHGTVHGEDVVFVAEFPLPEAGDGWAVSV